MSAQAPHVLVVDDDREIRTSLAEYLERHSYHVSLASDASQARRTLADERIDLILLDIMMPGEDGLSLCRSLATEARHRVIFLSALDATVERIAGLRAGGDDYLCKPFDPQELLARIEAVLRRGDARVEDGEGGAVSSYRFDRWRLDVTRRELVREDGVVFALGAGELRLIIAFLDRPGRVLARERLIELIGGEPADVFDRSIDSRVSRIRRKLEREPRRPTLIRTVRGDGYCLDARVERS